MWRAARIVNAILPLPLLISAIASPTILGIVLLATLPPASAALSVLSLMPLHAPLVMAILVVLDRAGAAHRMPPLRYYDLDEGSDVGTPPCSETSSDSEGPG